MATERFSFPLPIYDIVKSPSNMAEILSIRRKTQSIKQYRETCRPYY